MHKKILFSIAFNFYSFNHCFFQSAVNTMHVFLEKRAEYASRLDNDINRFVESIFSPTIEKPSQKREVMSLEEFPGSIPHEAQQMIKALIDPKKHSCSQGYIFYGEPGTGKNTLVNVIAKEAKAHLIERPASEFMDTYIGRGAAEIRQVFSRARDASRDAPVIIFIDEIDTIGSPGNGDNAEVKQTYSQLLISMNQIQSHHPIVVIGATNNPDSIKGALHRTGRFNLVHIEMPNKEERLKILNYYARKYNCVFDANFYKKIVEQTDGFCCASLEGIFKQAQYYASEYEIPIAKNHINKALEREIALHLKRQQMQKNNKERSHDTVQAQHLSHSKTQLSLSTFNTALSVVSFLTYLFI